MKKLMLLIFLMSSLLMAQTSTVEDFDDPSDPDYWGVVYSDNADTNIARMDLSYQTTTAVDGSALTVDWAAHNIEGWGGFSKFEYVAPDSSVMDWSAYDTLNFYFYCETPQSTPGDAHLRLNLYEVSDVPDSTQNGNDTEFYYSFHYGLLDDSTSSWIKVSIPLIAGAYWNGEGFNRTGWAGVAGNEQLDLDAIKGYTFEVSIGGSGEGNFSEGKYILDRIFLSGVAENPWVLFNGKTLAPELGGFTWGQSAMEIVEGGGIDPATNALLWTQGDEWSNGWSGAGWNVSPAKDLGFRWGLDSLKFAMKAESGTNSPIIMQFESITDGQKGVRGMEFEITADDQWHEYAIPLRDMYVRDDAFAWDSTAITVFQMMGSGNAQAGKKLWIDFLWTGNPPIDVVAPVAPTGVAGVAGTYQNLITWVDVPAEDNATYTVLFSKSAITSLEDEGLDVVASGIAPGTQIATHVITAPGQDTEVTYHYAVYATDQAGNVGALAPSAGVTNTAKGVATIANALSNFVADGDLSEWADVDIIRIYPSDGSGTIVNNTTIDGDSDISLDAYLAIDNDYLYFAADVEDDVIDVDSTDGETWMRDGVDLFIGLYNQVGPKHTSYKRGAEPDYHFRFSQHQIQFDFSGGGDPIKPGQDYYWGEKFGTGYVVEGRISLDDLAGRAGDDRFQPEVGMKLPIDYSINDADGSRREGILTLSQANQDQSWNNPARWTHSWISSTVGVEDDEVAVLKYQLDQNYPNPFNPATTINYSIVESGMVSLKVYNVLGQEVASLVNTVQSAGFHQVSFDASNLASGIYMYRLEAGSFVSIKKMMLLK